MGWLDRFRRRPREQPDADAPGLFTARSSSLPPTLEAPPPPADDAPAPASRDLWDRSEADVVTAEVATPDDVSPEAEAVAELAALDELAPEDGPAAAPETPVPPVDLPAPSDALDDALWDGSTWEDDASGTPAGEPADDAVAAPVEGSTADEPLFGARAPVEEAPAPGPVPPLFDPPQPVVEPAPDELAQPTAPEPAGEDAPPQDARPQDAAPEVDDEGRTMRVHDGRLDNRPGPIRMTPSEAIALAQDGPRALRRGRGEA